LSPRLLKLIPKAIRIADALPGSATAAATAAATTAQASK
jgi:hypothetical protein